MAGEIPRVVGGVLRTAPGAVSGVPGGHVLYNLVHQGAANYQGVSPGRHGERPTSRMRDFWGDGRVEGTVRAIAYANVVNPSKKNRLHS